MAIGRRERASILLLTALLLSSAGGSYAQDALVDTAGEKAMELGPIVNTATRAPRPVSAIPGSVIVIEREQIEQQLSISKDPTDILSKLIPGFSSSNQTVSGSAESFRGRGVQVLVDGVSRNTPLRDVSRIISLIDLNQIERIEVVNGASSIYGNGATGGIVNFITKDSTDGAPSVTASIGLRAFTADVDDSLVPEASVSLSGDAELFDYFAVLSAEATRDTFDGDGNRLPDDPLLGQGAFGNSESYNGLIKLGRDFGSRRLQVSAEVTRFDQDPDFFTDYSTEPARVDFSAPYTGRNIYEDSNYQAVEFTDGSFPLGNLSIRAFRNDIEKRFADAQLSEANTLVYISPDDGQTTFRADQLGIRTTVDTELDDVYESLTLTWGFDYTHDETTQEFQDGVEAIAPMTQNSYAGFLQAEASPLDWLLVRGGVRYERFDLEIDDFTRPSYRFLQGNGSVFTLAPVDVRGGDTSYDEFVFNLGAVVFLTDEVEVFGAFSQGYSLPDVGGFTRRAGQNLPFGGTVDVSDIAPEAQLVDNYEIGLRGNWDRVRGSLSGYVSQSELGTNFDVSTNEVVQQEERIIGVEAVLEGDVTERLTLGGVFSWSEGKRDTDDDGKLDSYLPNNRIGPPLRLTGFADYKTHFDLDLRLEAVYSGSRDRNDGVERVEIEDTITFNLAADYPLLGGSLGVGVENLLDATYENPTASASRNRPVNGFGRIVSFRYSRVF